ncbi:MAG TPA: sigma-70 family RNA polymerase sigma factor [Planctomycetota bacterium]
MGSDSTRPSLLARLSEGRDEADWREFESRYRDLVLRFCRRRGLQAADAEDACQLVFMALARALPGFRYDPGRGRFRDYLARVTQNTIHHLLACPERDLRLLETEVLDSLRRAPEDPLDPVFEDEWTQHHFRLAMRSVRTRSRPASLEVFERLLAGETVAGVARASGMSEEAVHKVKQRVGERLRQEIERQVRDEELLEPRNGSDGAAT